MKYKRTWGPTPSYELVKNYVPPDKEFVIISGPCSVEHELQIHSIAKHIKGFATHLRGGTFRTGTYPSNGWGLIPEHLLEAHQRAAHDNELKNIMEVLDYSTHAFDLYLKHADCFQVGSRQMQNYSLLRMVAQSGKPVFLKRNQGSTLDEWLGAAEHLLFHGAKEIYLVERGSSTFLDHVRWDLSISIIPAAQSITRIPIICDASHGTGRSDLVAPMAYAGVAAGADGLLIECHDNPSKSLSDKEQAITPNEFIDIIIKSYLIRSTINGR